MSSVGRCFARATLACLAAGAGTAAHAHAPVRTPSGALGEGIVTALLVLAAVAYSIGLHRVWRRVGFRAQRLNTLRALSFGAGLSFVAAALVSPLDRGGGQFFSLHMIQHELLMLVAAPLLVAGRPLPLFLWCFGDSARASVAHAGRLRVVRTVWRALLSPLMAWTLHALTLWLWHVPAFFDAAMRNALVHDVQHVTFLAAALAFWAALFETRRPEQQGAAVLYLFTTTVHTSVLGALITFATHPWYSAYLQIPRDIGLTALEDQQLGGLIMWVPGSIVYVGVALALLVRWIGASDSTGTVHRVAGGRERADSERGGMRQDLT